MKPWVHSYMQNRFICTSNVRFRILDGKKRKQFSVKWRRSRSCWGLWGFMSPTGDRTLSLAVRAES